MINLSVTIVNFFLATTEMVKTGRLLNQCGIHCCEHTYVMEVYYIGMRLKCLTIKISKRIILSISLMSLI